MRAPKHTTRALGWFLILAAGCSADAELSDRSRGNNPLQPGGEQGDTFRPGTVAVPGSSNPSSQPSAAGSGAKPAPNLDSNTCASAQVTASRITPTVYLVIDGSSSMSDEFGGGGTRWNVLRNALIGQDGVVSRLESVVEFGTAVYSNNNPDTCPAMAETAPALNNLETIIAGYPDVETGGGTPTGEALQQVVDSLPDFSVQGPDAEPQTAPIIILATDGEPNGCAEGFICDWVNWDDCLGKLLTSLANAPITYETTLAAARAAAAKAIPIWVVSLADGLDASADLQRTANIGAGLPEDASPGATIYSPQNPNELTETLTQLIGDVVSCEVELAGTLSVDRACEGSVQINGSPLNCNDEQGWKPVDESRIVLQGDACARFKSDPSVVLDARFPCDVVTPL
jgi:hypothetical protein